MYYTVEDIDNLRTIVAFREEYHRRVHYFESRPPLYQISIEDHVKTYILAKIKAEDFPEWQKYLKLKERRGG